jgi:hypothetical protein
VAAGAAVRDGHRVVVPGPLVSLGPGQVDSVPMVVRRMMVIGVPVLRILAEAQIAKGLLIYGIYALWTFGKESISLKKIGCPRGNWCIVLLTLSIR